MTEQEYNHLKEMYERNLITKETFDKATIDYEADNKPVTDNKFLNSLLDENDFDMQKQVAKNIDALEHAKHDQEEHDKEEKEALEKQKEELAQQKELEKNVYLQDLVKPKPVQTQTQDNSTISKMFENVSDESSELPYCQNCGTQYKNSNQAFCLECGTKKGNGNKYCPQCGTKKKHENQDVCLNCGYDFSHADDFATPKSEHQGQAAQHHTQPVIVNVQNENHNTNHNNTNTNTNPYQNSTFVGKPVNKLIYLLLCFFLGSFGIHRMYAGKPGGIMMLLFSWTFIPMVISWIDLVIGLLKPADEAGNIYF